MTRFWKSHLEYRLKYIYMSSYQPGTNESASPHNFRCCVKLESVSSYIDSKRPWRAKNLTLDSIFSKNCQFSCFYSFMLFGRLSATSFIIYDTVTTLSTESMRHIWTFSNIIHRIWHCDNFGDLIYEAYLDFQQHHSSYMTLWQLWGLNLWGIFGLSATLFIVYDTVTTLRT